MILVISLMSSLAIAETITLPLSPTKSSGYIGEVRFDYGIRNCYGNISAGFGNLVVSSNQYLYEGKTYTPSDLGLTEFSKPGLRYTIIFADLYHGSANLGRIKMDNVVFFSGVGCFSETYHITKLAGVKDADYKDKIAELSLRNFEIQVNSSSTKIDNLIYNKLSAESAKAAAEEKAQKAAKRLEEEKAKAADELKKAEELKKAKASVKDSKNEAKTDAAQEVQNTKNTTTNVKKSADTAIKSTPKGPTAEEVEAQKRQQIKQYIEESQQQFEHDKVAVDQAAQGLAGAATGFASGISGSGNGVGLSLMYVENTDKDSPFNPTFIGLVFGHVSDPTLEENKSNLISGVETQFAFSDEWGNSPQSYATNKYSKVNRRWDVILEMKFFGNITALTYIQPYLGIGYAGYADFDRKNNKVGSDWAFTTSYGISIIGNFGGFHLGVNSTMKVSEMGFFIHM